eukprot:1194932-Prorocentrum_minimum.AAC.7
MVHVDAQIERMMAESMELVEVREVLKEERWVSHVLRETLEEADATAHKVNADAMALATRVGALEKQLAKANEANENMHTCAPSSFVGPIGM